jgi:O-antigen ligase
MPTRESKFQNYNSISPKHKSNGGNGDISSLKKTSEVISSLKKSDKINAPLFPEAPLTLTPVGFIEKKADHFTELSAEEITLKDSQQTEKKNGKKIEEITNPLSYAEQKKIDNQQKIKEKDEKLLNQENWLARNGHTITYIGIYVFTVFVLFRPYEIFTQLSFLSTSAFFIAFATLLFYLPTQFSSEGNLTFFTVEVKSILFITLLALLTIPIAKSPALAWETFNATFVKAVIIFVVMVNVLRTESRLKGIIWISLAVGAWLSYTVSAAYIRGEANVEGYRFDAGVKGLFGNPNDLSLHLVTMIPIAFTLALGAKSKTMKLFLFSLTLLFLISNFFTYSRGGFLGLIGTTIVLAWKLGRKERLKTMFTVGFFGAIAMLVAPGNFGLRILSIFIPGLDAVGSGDQRTELLKQSILVTLRNPWGIGIGNFPIVGTRNLETHNAYTQVSSEIGVIALIALLIFLISPIKKLGAIERTLYDKQDYNWIYYLSVGLQASLITYMISSFFGPVAYNWFMYYLVAYAVVIRRIYQIETKKEQSLNLSGGFGSQTVNGF